MKDKFPFTTVESQIEKLKSQHLTINDEEKAKELGCKACMKCASHLA